MADMISQTVEEVAEAMRTDPEAWAKIYLAIKEQLDIMAATMEGGRREH